MDRQEAPHFPVTLVYELGRGKDRRTIIFDNPGNGADTGWWQSEVNDLILPVDFKSSDWLSLVQEIREKKDNRWKPLIINGNWPGKEVGLPQTILAYTTGEPNSWEDIFRREPPASDVDIVSQSLNYDANIERPAEWNRSRELQYQTQLLSEESKSAVKNLRRLEEESSGRERDQDVCIFITPALLKFALLSVTLEPAMDALMNAHSEEAKFAYFDRLKEDADNAEGLGRLLAQVGWVWPVSISLTVDFQPIKWPKFYRNRIRPFFENATTITREPDPGTLRRLLFDLKAKNIEGVEVGYALIDLLGGRNSHPYEHFKQLLSLYRDGLIADINIIFQKIDPQEILLFDELSDGEQVYLGRMALFHLMEGRDDAMIMLDEPETHFNDKWKREIVDIIDEALKETANDVLIATHSSIALTDVFNDEIVLFEKSDGTAHLSSVTSTTFGADPSEIMINVFKTPDSIGKRSLEWLNAQLEKDWKPEQKAELEKVIRSIGPGLHRSELRTIWRKLNASQD